MQVTDKHSYETDKAEPSGKIRNTVLVKLKFKVINQHFLKKKEIGKKQAEGK